MRRVDIKAILADPKQRQELIGRATKFLCDLEGHDHTEVRMKEIYVTRDDYEGIYNHTVRRSDS